MIRIIAGRTNSEKENISEIKDMLISNRRLLLFILLFTAGMIAGVMVFKSNSSAAVIKLLSIFNTYREIRAEQSLLINVVNSFATSFIYVAIAYVFGLCALGAPAVSLLPFVRGLGIGVISGYLYNEFALAGLGYCALILYPGLLLSLLAMLLCCNESILMAKDMLLLVSFKNNEYTTSLKMYSVRYLFFCFLTAVAALIDAAMITLFSNLFSF